MLRIWGRENSINVQKVLWCCRELGLDHERIDAGGPFGGTRDPEYLAMNPNGLVPAISESGFTLWESNVIVRYLSAKHGLGTPCPEDLQQRADAEGTGDLGLGRTAPDGPDDLLAQVFGVGVHAHMVPPGQLRCKPL